MDLTALGAFITGVGGLVFGVAAFLVGRRDKARDAADRAAAQAQQQHHEDRSVAVEEIEVAIKWQNEIIKLMRDENRQLREVHGNCQNEINELRDEQAIDRRIIDELRTEIRRLEAKVAELERSRP